MSSKALPNYLGLLVVDMKDFGGRPSREHEELTTLIPETLRSAFTRAGLGDVWSEREFGRTTGDGYVAGFRSRWLPFLLDPLLDCLQDELRARNLARPASRPVRMRASVHVGPLSTSGGDEDWDGSGAARVQAHRLVDAPEVKALLTRSTDATCLVALVSQRVMEDVVLSGYAARGAEFYVSVPVRVKELDVTAHLRVPEPSGDLLGRGMLPPRDSAVPAADSTAAAPTSARTVIARSFGAVHTGDGDQYNDGRSPRSREDRRGR